MRSVVFANDVETDSSTSSRSERQNLALGNRVIRVYLSPRSWRQNVWRWWRRDRFRPCGAPL